MRVLLGVRLSIPTLVLSVLALVASGRDVPAQTALAAVRGEVVDVSGGVLPGVTIAARTEDGRVVGHTVTDAEGQFVLQAVPPGAVTLTFELPDFEPAAMRIVIVPGSETAISTPLRVAQLAEHVVVVGEMEPALPRAIVPSAPRPVVTPVPLEDMESVCGPSKADPDASASGTIQAHRHDQTQLLYRLGDEVILDIGTNDGIEAGVNFVARRRFRAAGATGADMRGEHTAGVVQVVSVSAQTSNAVVIHACNELRKGDQLAPFTPELIAAVEPAGAPAFNDAARILFADDGQMLGSHRRMMVIDRGAEQGIRPGQRMTLFRRRLSGPGRVIIGEAVVLAVRHDSARIRVESTSDAIQAGDSAAPHSLSRPVAQGK